MDRRVVVTGIGVVSSIGVGRRAFWVNLLAGRSGITTLEAFDDDPFDLHKGGQIKDFPTLEPAVDESADRRGRASLLALTATRQALDDAGLAREALVPENSGVALGTTSGEPQELERLDTFLLEDDLAGVGPDFVTLYAPHVISAHVASEVGLEGGVTTLSAACASGGLSISCAFDAVRSGQAELMLAGGVEAFSRVTFIGFARLGAVAPEMCQPFDRQRRGLIPGEGAAVLVLEPRTAAMARGARVYAEVLGYGLTCDAHHMTASHPEGDGAARAMNRALRASGVTPADVSYISAHGTGTKSNDRLETLAVKRVFEHHAHDVPMSSVKSMLGHTMGAAAAMEAAVCALAIHSDQIPPTINLHHPDPECDLDYVPGQAREQHVDIALNNAFGFGGTNVSVVFRKCVG